ncbi:MAG: PIN domain nuclease [Acidobacteriota bacterium]|nr:PIN domain nuclease [Acidobacteriota bacterium]
MALASTAYLADTTVLNRLADPDVQAVTRPLIKDGLLRRTSISDLEIGFSARNAAEWDDLQAVLRPCPVETVTASHFDAAKRTQRALADGGLRCRKVPDLLIAAVAQAAGLTVLHYDRDYDLIAEVTGQDTKWVVPPGSAD